MKRQELFKILFSINDKSPQKKYLNAYKWQSRYDTYFGRFKYLQTTF